MRNEWLIQELSQLVSREILASLLRALPDDEMQAVHGELLRCVRAGLETYECKAERPLGRLQPSLN